MAKDLYAVLGVEKTADQDTIKKTFRKVAAKLHPDKNPGDQHAEARFKEVSHAHDVLGDPRKRALYDEFGEDGLRDGFDAEQARAYKSWSSQGGGPRGGAGFPGGVRLEDLFGGAAGNGGGFGDVFGDMFGRRGGARPGRRRGQDVEAETTIDFASAVRGATLQLTVAGQAVTVRIPPGADEGSRVRIAGHGAPAPAQGGAPGDLLLTLHVQPHPHFRRESDDLHVDLPITLAEAYQGAKVRVPTVDGGVHMKVPPRTQAGTKMRLKGKGIARKGREPGDLYVHFKVLVPTSEAEEVARAVEVLARHQPDDPRAGVEL